MRSKRCSLWIQTAVCVAIVTSISGAEALACHDVPRDAVSVGFGLGISFAPRIRFIYGIHARFGTGETAGFLRVEGRGLLFARATAGLTSFYTDGGGGEAGLTVHSRHAGGDAGASLGVHLAAGAADDPAALMLQGAIPIMGDPRNWDFSGLALWMPGACTDVY